MFSGSMQSSVELCISLRQCKKKKCKPPWFHKNGKFASTKKRQALKQFGELPTASNTSRLLKTIQKTRFIPKETKCSLISISFEII